MAYDTARGVAVLFGGGDSNGFYLDDTWEWNSATMTWTERFPAHRPAPRLGHRIAYDAARDLVVLFGGVTPVAQENNETWVWDGNDWTQVFPVGAPAPRWLPGMVYDSQRQVIVLFGGLEGGNVFGDTWEWDGSNWTEQLIPGPPARAGVGMAYDCDRNVSVLFGGTNTAQFFNDTWERAGDGPWQEVTTANKPSQRNRPGMAYFPQLRRVVLYGGSRFQYYDDTFLWNGAKWGTRPFDPRPAGRCCFGMVYDPVSRAVLLFGGSVSFLISGETWLFR